MEAAEGALGAGKQGVVEEIARGLDAAAGDLAVAVDEELDGDGRVQIGIGGALYDVTIGAFKGWLGPLLGARWL